MDIHKELARIQRELKAPKNQHNKFGGYNYRNAEDILEAYKKVAGETALVINDDVVQVGDRYYIKATATLVLGSEATSATAYAREPEAKKGMDESQISGAASSYARKYAMNALFAIDDTKDADSQDNTQAQPAKPVISEELRKQIADTTTEEQLKAIWEKNKGLGKEFAKLVTEQKAFIKSVQTEETEIN